MTVISELIENIAGASVAKPLPFRSPVYRSRTDGSGMVSSVTEFVKVDGGVVRVELAPGPAEVQLGGKWVPFIVPEAGTEPVPLWPLIEDGVQVYQPPTVSLVKSYRDEVLDARDVVLRTADGIADIAADVEKVELDRAAAEVARGGAESAQSAAAGSASAAAGSASAAASAETRVKDSESKAAASKTAAADSATAAGSARSAAAGSATAAAGSATAAGTSASNAAGSATAAGGARDAARGFRDEAAVSAERAATAATGSIPNGSLAAEKFTPDVVANLERASTAVLEGDGRLNDPRPPTAHGHGLGDIAGFAEAAEGIQGQIAGKADLDQSGKLLAAQLPAQALTDFLGAVSTQAAMLTLVGQRGDWCTRSDRGTDWQLIAEPSSALASWREKTYPASPVSSVNGRTGAVDTSSADITDASAVGRSVLKAASAGAARTAIDAAASFHGHAVADVSGLSAALAQKVTGAAVTTIWSGTEAEYAALPAATKNANWFVAVVR